jgi:hypothetical protein
MAPTKAIADHTAARMKTLREDAPEVFLPGDGLPVVSPLNRRLKLAKVTATDPKPEAVVTDPDELRDWFLENHDDRCEDVDQLIGTTAQVIDALRQYAPAEILDQLVTTERTVPDYEVKNLLTRSAGTGQPIGPGGEVDENAPRGVEVRDKPSNVQVLLTEGAIPHILELWQAGLVDPLGLPPAPAALPE